MKQLNNLRLKIRQVFSYILTLIFIIQTVPVNAQIGDSAHDPGTHATPSRQEETRQAIQDRTVRLQGEVELTGKEQKKIKDNNLYQNIGYVNYVLMLASAFFITALMKPCGDGQNCCRPILPWKEAPPSMYVLFSGFLVYIAGEIAGFAMFKKNAKAKMEVDYDKGNYSEQAQKLKKAQEVTEANYKAAMIKYSVQQAAIVTMSVARGMAIGEQVQKISNITAATALEASNKVAGETCGAEAGFLMIENAPECTAELVGYQGESCPAGVTAAGVLTPKFTLKHAAAVAKCSALCSAAQTSYAACTTSFNSTFGGSAASVLCKGPIPVEGKSGYGCFTSEIIYTPPACSNIGCGIPGIPSGPWSVPPAFEAHSTLLKTSEDTYKLLCVPPPPVVQNIQPPNPIKQNFYTLFKNFPPSIISEAHAFIGGKGNKKQGSLAALGLTVVGAVLAFTLAWDTLGPVTKLVEIPSTRIVVYSSMVALGQLVAASTLGSAMELKKNAANYEKMFKKLQGLEDKTLTASDGSGSAGPQSDTPNPFQFAKDEYTNSECITNEFIADPECNCKKNNTCLPPGRTVLPDTVATGINFPDAYGNVMRDNQALIRSLGNGDTPAAVARAQSIRQNAARIGKINKKLLDHLNDLRAKNGDKPIDFNLKANNLVQKIQKNASGRLAKKGVDLGATFGSGSFVGAPSSDVPKQDLTGIGGYDVATYNPKAVGGNPAAKTATPGFELFDEEKEKKEEFSDISKEELDKFEIGADAEIVDKPGVPIWKILSVRYMKTAFPLFLDDKIETKKEK